MRQFITKGAGIPSYPTVSFLVPIFNEMRKLPFCIDSLYRCAVRYPAFAEIIIVDDGSIDLSYELAFASIQVNKERNPWINAKIIRHMTNLGITESMRTGVNRANGEITALVNTNSNWSVYALKGLIRHMLSNKRAAVMGYFKQDLLRHPNSENLFVIVQEADREVQSTFQNTQGIINTVLVVSDAFGLFKTNTLRTTVNA